MKSSILLILFCISFVTMGQNLLTNANFETGSVSPWLGFKNQVLVDDIINSNVGNIDNGDGSLYQVFTVNPGDTYNVAFDYRWFGSGSSNMIVRIKDGATAGSILTEYTLEQNTDVWYNNAEFIFTVPNTITTARVIFYKAPGNQPLRIDNVLVSNTTTTPSFVDADTPINAQPHGTIPGEWTLDFSDEFNGNQIDTNKWMVSVSTQSRAPRPNLGIDDWWWVQNNAFLDGNGQLSLRATKEDYNTMFCGSVETRDIYETTYGFMEARIEVAETAKGNHTAFWLQGENMGNVDNSGQDGAEIDIFESAWVTDDTKAVVDFDGYGPSKKNHTIPYDTPGLHSGFHIFGMLWTETEIRIFYDGQEVISTNPNKPFPFTVDNNGYPVVPQVPEWLWLSVGASFGDGDFINQPVGLLSDAKVDWVRVFKNNQTLGLNSTKKFDINIYPNPSDEKINILSEQKIEYAEIHNLNGVMIKTVKSSDLKFIEINDIPVGTYLLILKHNEGKVVKKIVVK